MLDREVYEARNVEFYEQYKSGTLDIHEFLDFQLKPLSRHPRSQLDAWHSEFMEERILPLITPDARKLINKHMLGRDLCVIITATNRFVTAPIARELGISNLIATEAEQRDGEYTGQVSGPALFQGRQDSAAGKLAGRA